MGRSFEQRFLDELTRQCAGEDIAINNKTLRENLGWMDERFDKVRAGLIKKGTIRAAPGHGGKTRFVRVNHVKPAKTSVSAFVSYAHADEDMKKRLLQHLKPLERLGLIKNWHDRMIMAGDTIDEVISAELENADIIFLLVSVDFINSKYCYEKELSRAVERHNSKTARIIPIILRSCLWKHSPFGGILSLPQDAKPVASWLDQDEAFTGIAEKVHDVINTMLLEST
ncbi:toll/interleukin-1 receptor domain-containing protein [Agrobacterium salinitolerans]|uniref:toll/interleukin-1 receptor domain-containing protein n=1 Tax=Agrobacterium salinitolerans TaxID=1183413 RepID=UPI0022B82F8E|nr:toll/interleukin-1 receptor domain-containing protein [Agrobacterium salinitolerans]MCZ7973392.1 toll/interleukin-1 receptor domain-containing protein [Agrobacterium salinitolerans]